MSAGPPKVFISYRRDDAAGHAGRIYDEIASRLGEESVLIDVTMLHHGDDFVERIAHTVADCEVMLVVMGPGWATLPGRGDQPRIADPDDHVRLEIEAALRRSDVRVIPLLVGGASMPEPELLPDGLQPLVRRQALELEDSRWDYDVGELVRVMERDRLESAPAAAVGTPPSPPRSAPPSRRESVFRRATARLRDALRGRAAPSRDGARPGEPPREPRDSAVWASLERAPPPSSYARLEAPDAVVCGHRFDVVVGLAPQAVEGVIGEELRVPDSVVGSYVLNVQVVADGFSLADGADWRVEMPVTARAPYPAVRVGLTAEVQEAPVRARSLQAVYSIDGQTIGLAVRPIAVLRDRAQQPPESAKEPDPGFDVALPEDWKAPDLSVHILDGKRESAGRLLWTFETPHAGLEVPLEEVVVEIGDEPEAFSMRLMKQMPAYEGQPDLRDYVVGIGRSVADKVPDAFWSLLAAVGKRSEEEAPSVLILSAEPYVPWELAVLDEPLDPGSPPFLSAQARVGRWVLGHRRPKLPPPMSAAADSIAVVFGVYDKPHWQRLVEAEAEAADLQNAYRALPVNADSETVLKCIKGEPPADVLHFAIHGNYDPSGAQDGLVLVDGRTLDPLVVKGNTFDSPRFVFLNACQVGTGHQVLGDYAGMAAAFLYAGAAGVVAPLWSINDAQARQLALTFYEEAFRGTAPADLLRRERASFGEDPRPSSSTFMAYQFFGHPDMRLARG